jgi:Flp pilus assembly protein TadD
MFERFFPGLRSKSLTGFGGVLLVLALLAAYANHFHNSFHFDDAHTIETNAAIRDLRNIPAFFRDATMFSSLPSNQSYRPLVSTLLTIDYRLAGGLQPFWFHLSVFVLFLGLIALLVFFIYRLLEASAASSRNVSIALAAAGLYGLHPANADTINYISASSDLISTLGVIGSFVIYATFPQLRRYYVYALPASAAILAKPVAAIFPLLFATYSLLFQPANAPRLQRLAQTAMPFVTCGALLLFVQRMTPHSWIAGAANTRNYLITQPYVVMLYFRTFFWPSDLSADYDLNPFTTTDDPRFWAGFAFIVLLVAMSVLAARFKGTRVIGFGLLWFFISLLPTSLFPLAEVMNDHRTFLPHIGLVISFAGAISFLLPIRLVQLPITKLALPGVILLILCASCYATFQRNKVWKTEETLWRNVTIKSPRNSRGLMNYGNTLMAKGQFKDALDYFHRALALAPQYSVLFINLAVAEDATKQTATAEQHFKEALRLAPSLPDSYTYYARYLLTHSRTAEARALLQTALTLGPTDVTARDLLAKADPRGTQSETPESYLAASLEHYRGERYAETITAAQAALKLRPNYAEAWNNICAAYNKLGRYDDAAPACEQALRCKPDFELARNNLEYARKMAKAQVK